MDKRKQLKGFNLVIEVLVVSRIVNDIDYDVVLKEFQSRNRGTCRFKVCQCVMSCLFDAVSIS